MSNKDKSNQTKQGKSVIATVETTPAAVIVEVSPLPQTTIPHGSGIQGDAEKPEERRPLTAKERLAAALLESPPEAGTRHKDNPVFKALEDVADIIRDCKLGINNKPKMSTKQVCAYLGKAGITCSTASLSNFYAEKGWTRNGKSE